MVVLGVAVAAVAAFVLSSAYYTAVTPLEVRALGDAALDRGRPAPWKVLTELARTAVVAAAFAWIAGQAGLLALPDTLRLALLTWIAFPVVLLTGSITWERVPVITAAMHAGDWLLKLLLIAVVLGLLH
jgi:hypothetical protein